MVMHARKIPRLNDGYYDRGQARPIEDKNPSKSRHYNDRYGDKPHESPGKYARYRERDESPRYPNKTAFMEKHKDKPEKGATEKPRDGSWRGGESSRASNNHNKDGAASREGPRPGREQNEKDHRVMEVHKNAVRVCGDWSEHISSSGKRYYYNCKTTVSKWEKPKEWVDGPNGESNRGIKSKDNRGDGKVKQASVSASKGMDDRHRHSNTDTKLPTKPAAATSGSPASSRLHGDRPGTTFNSASFPSSTTPSSTSTATATTFFSTSSFASRAHDKHKQSAACSTSSVTNSLESAQRPPLVHAKPWQTQQQQQQQQQQQGHHEQSKASRGDGSASSGGLGGAHTAQSYDRSLSNDGYGGPVGYRDRHGRKESAALPCPSAAMSGSGSGGRTGVPPTSLAHNSSVDHQFNGTRQAWMDNDDSRHDDDMDISPGSTPTEESMMEKVLLPSILTNANTFPPSSSTPVSTVTSTPPLFVSGSSSSQVTTAASLPNLSALGVLPQLLQKLGVKTLQQINSQNITQQAISTLQKLQQVLIVQQQQQQQRQLQMLLQQLQQQLATQQQQPQKDQSSSGPHRSLIDDGSQSPYSPPDESDGTPLQSPEYVAPTSFPPGFTPHREHEEKNRDSPKSERSVKSARKESPSPSHSNHQVDAVSNSTSQLAAAHRKQDDSIHLTPSLANYYNSSAVDHVSGWQGESLEEQALHYAEEGHVVGSLQCTQVSVDLKRARSLVRVGEIEDTLRVQRILFLRQQIKELDSWRSQSTFMPSSVKDP